VKIIAIVHHSEIPLGFRSLSQTKPGLSPNNHYGVLDPWAVTIPNSSLHANSRTPHDINHSSRIHQPVNMTPKSGIVIIDFSLQETPDQQDDKNFWACLPSYYFLLNERNVSQDANGMAQSRRYPRHARGKLNFRFG
jgi:hypothetical protein